MSATSDELAPAGQGERCRLDDAVLAAARAARAEVGEGTNSFVHVPDDDVLLAASRASRAVSPGGTSSGSASLVRPLESVPVAVKDTIDVTGMPTTCGSTLDAMPTRDATVVARLRGAGAVVVGKTHTHQFAFGTTGDLAATGPARNPSDPTRMAGGSSAGSAVAVARGIVPVALGTDTAGSIRIPAALTGVVGFKPTHGALPVDGVHPLAPSLDTVGVLAADVRLAARAWKVLAADGRDGAPTTAADSPATDSPVAREAAGSVTDPAADLVPLDVGELRLLDLTGREDGRATSRIEGELRRARGVLEAAGVSVGSSDVAPMDLLRMAYLAVVGTEGAVVHAEQLAERPELYLPEIADRIAMIGGVREQTYQENLAVARRARTEISEVLGDAVVLMPTVPIETPAIGARAVEDDSGQELVWGGLAYLTSPWNVAGLPAVSLPVPVREGLPVGLQLVAAAGKDLHLLRAALTVERILAER